MAKPDDRLGDHAEVLGDDAAARRAPLDRVEEGRARTAPPRPCRAVLFPLGTAQYETKPRKWSTRVRSTSSNARRKRSIHQRSRRRASPTSRTTGCPTADRSSRTGPAARLRRRPTEELRVCEVVGAAVGDVDRHVAEDAHAALPAYARSAPHSRSKRTWSSTLPPNCDPVVDPVRVAGAERLHLGAVTARLRLREQRGRAGERGRPTCTAIRQPVGRPERQHLPPALARRGEPVDEAERVLSSTPPGNELGCRRMPCARSFMRLPD